MKHISTTANNAFYFLLQLDPRAKQLSVRGFKKEDAQLAEDEYTKAETQITRDKSDSDAVLVSVETVNALSKAYPNYFADTGLFSELMNQAIEGKRRRAVLSGVKLQQGKLDFD